MCFWSLNGRDTDWIYPNGLSISLPREVQKQWYAPFLVWSMRSFAAYAYAIEYDAVDARELKHTWKASVIGGL
jgi:tRNA uridine 5-carboxymethylaminomethyl modification enzyme